MNRRKFTSTAAASATSFFFTASAQRSAAHRPDAGESKRADGVTREVAEFIVNTTYDDVPGDVMDSGKALDKHYPARYPNTHPAGAPGDLYTAAEAERAINDAARVIEYVRRHLSWAGS